MSQVRVSFQMDTKLKERFEEFCFAVGMNLSTAFNLFASAVLRERRIPFEIALDSEPNGDTPEAAQEGERMPDDREKVLL